MPPQESKHPIYVKFKSLIMEAKVKKVGNDYQHRALEKLWSLLEYPQMHSKIIDLIIAFSEFFPYEFTKTVKKGRTSVRVRVDVWAARRFADGADVFVTEAEVTMVAVDDSGQKVPLSG